MVERVLSIRRSRASSLLNRSCRVAQNSWASVLPLIGAAISGAVEAATATAVARVRKDLHFSLRKGPSKIVQRSLCALCAL